MAYIKKIVEAGKDLEISKYYSARYGRKGAPRRPNEEKTDLPQWRVNEKNAENRLRLLILCNFREEDWRLNLTYADNPPDGEQAYKDLTNFIRRLKRLYKKHGHELKWVGTTELRGHRVHHHLLINNIKIDRKEIAALWPHAKLNYRSMHFYDGQVDDAARVAKYFIKETRETFYLATSKQKQRWRASRNLVQPKITREVIHSKSWREKPKAIKGYYVADVVNSWTRDGYPFQFYRLVREEDDYEKISSRKRKQKRSVHHPQQKRKV